MSLWLHNFGIFNWIEYFIQRSDNHTKKSFPMLCSRNTRWNITMATIWATAILNEQVTKTTPNLNLHCDSSKNKQTLFVLKAYFQSTINDLKMAAYAGIYSFEQSSNTKMNFHFHDDALRHMARLTRVLVLDLFCQFYIDLCLTSQLIDFQNVSKSMSRSHALLLSLQPGLGRTTLVRYVAHLSKMKVSLGISASTARLFS